jgi:hypothetical protein
LKPRLAAAALGERPSTEANMRRSIILSALLSMAATGCAAPKMDMAPRAPVQAAAPEAPAPAVQERSFYARDANGSLTEDQLQKVLAMPIDLQLPARVGVVALGRPYDASEGAHVRARGVAARRLAKALVGGDVFSHVTDMSTDLPRAEGIEGLRVLASRYRLRYLLLYTERFEDDTHANGWAALYATGIGVLLAPGVTVESHGIAQVDLLDVRTGTILFSVVEPMHVRSQQLVVAASRAHLDKQHEEIGRAVDRLSRRVASQAQALVRWADESAANPPPRRILPAPVLLDPPAVAPASVAASP